MRKGMNVLVHERNVLLALGLSVLCLSVSVLSCKSGGQASGAPGGGGDSAITLTDPTGDDKGPGTYTYPTDQVYKPGSFDMTKLEIVPNGDTVEIRLTLAVRIEDAWDSKAWQGNGFSTQMAFVHFDTDHVAGSGVQDSLPGTNVRFASDEAWDRVVIISPQPATRVNSEIDSKAAQWKDKIVVPRITRASGKTLIALVDAAKLGTPSKSWGIQVLMQSNEGFPAKTDLLTRKVNEFEGQHRFGGGTDYDNDPQVLDIFVAPATGSPAEIEGQYEILKKYNAAAQEPKPEDLAVVPMIYLGK